MSPRFDNTLIQTQPNWAKRVIVSTSLAGLGAGMHLGGHFFFYGGTAGEEGAIVDLRERSAMLLTDIDNKPAFLNYLALPGDNTDPPTMTVSISTEEAMPETLSNPLGQLTTWRQKHVSQMVTPEEFRPIPQAQANLIRGFFKEFEELTGIHVIVTENDPKAQIVIGGFSPRADYIGFASFPQEIPHLSPLPQHHGFMMLDTTYLQHKLDEGNAAAALALVSHEFGHNLGLLHPFDHLVDTGMTPKQQRGVSRMSYNTHTFPVIAQTHIDSGFGPLDIFLLRDALKQAGFTPPPVRQYNDHYNLQDIMNSTLMSVREKDGPVMQVPAISLLDTGGKNTLEGTAGDDILVTESGYCGIVNRNEQRISMLKDGAPYCAVEGEFSVVRSGGGNDLVLAARGNEQHIFLTTGIQEVAMLYADMGEKTIHVEQEPKQEQRTGVFNFQISLDQVIEKLCEGQRPMLTLHHSLFDSGQAQVQISGEDVVLTFLAPSGRQVGRITLAGQAKGGPLTVQKVRVIGNDAETLFSLDTRTLESAEDWERQLILPVEKIVHEAGVAGIRADINRARQALAGEVGEWTAKASPDPVAVKSAGDGHAPPCPCGMQHDFIASRDATPAGIILHQQPAPAEDVPLPLPAVDGSARERITREKKAAANAR